MSVQPKSSWLLTVDEYLAFEEQSDVRHEYVGGRVHAMAGASERHQIIVFNIASALREAARAYGYSVILNAVKLRVADDVIYYPDLMLLCDPSDNDPSIKERPALVVEVLSPSTTPTDRREKMITYRRLPSVLCYLAVHQDKRLVVRHWRESANHRWEFAMVESDEIEIPGVGVQISVDQIYERVDVDAPA